MLQVRKLLNEAHRNRKKLNILTAVTHERYEPNLAKTGHTFWSWQGGDIRQWNTQYAPIPENYHILDPLYGDFQLPEHVDIDVVLSQNTFAHLPTLLGAAQQMGVPCVNLWHTLPPTGFDFRILQANAEALSQCVNVFISEYNRDQWGFTPDNGVVIRHGIDTDFWHGLHKAREYKALSVVNDWVNRDWCCGFTQWNEAIRKPGVPHTVIGNTPGLSEAAPSLEYLRDQYALHHVFVNTSTVSPIPMSVLEAMASGCAIVSTNTCMIPEIITDGVEGFLVEPNDVDGLREKTMWLLDPDNIEAGLQMAKKAREKVASMFGLDRFVQEWNELLWRLTTP